MSRSFQFHTNSKIESEASAGTDVGSANRRHRVTWVARIGQRPRRTARPWIFQVVSRYERGSIVLTSNRGFGDWGQVVAIQVVATAFLDRLLHHSTAVNIKSQSYRMRAHVSSGREGGVHAHTVMPPTGATPFPGRNGLASCSVRRF